MLDSPLLSTHHLIRCVVALCINMQGVVWLKEKVASAIRMCPGKAAVVFDNAHVLKGEDILLLDPLLLLFDDKW